MKSPTTGNAPVQLEFTRAPDHKNIYVNHMRIGVALGDIQISLGQIDMVPLPIGSAPKVEDQSTLIMSVPQAKAFVRMLSKSIADYETQFGTVNIPEQFLTPVDLRTPPKAA